MKKTKDNTQTGKNSKNERIRACMDELKHLLAMTEHEFRMLCDLCALAHPTCRESKRMAIGSTGMNSDESLDAIIEHTQKQIVDYMSIRGGVVSKPELMFVFGESEMTSDAIDGLIEDKKIVVVNGEFTTIGYSFGNCYSLY